MSARPTTGEGAPDYAAPAVDKALDILEVLADAGGARGQLEIANAVSRSPAQIFRVLLRLERRGYVYRDAQTGLYQLSMRLFDLAHRHEPLRSLITAASPSMRTLADSIGQSCNLGVLDEAGVRVVAQAETPADFGFKIRVGAVFPMDTTTGMLLAAYDPRASRLIEPRAAEAIRADGHLVRADEDHPAITDVVYPILRTGRPEAVAALTVPLVDSSFATLSVDAVSELTAAAAREIQTALGI